MGVACTEERPVMHWVREIIKFRRLFLCFHEFIGIDE